MSRKAISQTVQAEVLLESRRRCCICYGLSRDTSIKQVQIAHLDKDSSNNSKDNLAILCVNHHDQYDSRTSQSKNFTLHEVERFRVELLEAIESAFGNKVQFGEVKLLGSSITGHYVRDSNYDSVEIRVKRLGTGQYHVSGEALWGVQREYGPNVGDLDFIAKFDINSVVLYLKKNYGGEVYKARLAFDSGNLIVSEENWVGMFGMNVMFSGEYTRAS